MQAARQVAQAAGQTACRCQRSRTHPLVKLRRVIWQAGCKYDGLEFGIVGRYILAATNILGHYGRKLLAFQGSPDLDRAVVEAICHADYFGLFGVFVGTGPDVYCGSGLEINY